jgi:hypothetical protein
MDQGHQLSLSFRSKISSIREKPTQLLIAWNSSSHHMTRDDSHEWQVEIIVQALIKAVDSEPPEKIRPCDLVKLMQSLKLMAFQM